MNLDPLSTVSAIAGKLIDRFIPDPAAKQAAALQLMQMQQTGELAQLASDTDLARAQVAVDQAEATSSSVFVAGGRPFILWVMGVGLANDFVVRPFAIFLASLFHVSGAIWPALDMASLMPLLLGILGLGAMRSFDKSQAGK